MTPSGHASSGQTSHISVYDSVGESQASTLLRLGLLGPRRPIDDLADRLSEPGAATWLDSMLEIGTTAAIGKPRSVLLMGATSIDDLGKVKDEGKRRYRSSETADGRLGGLAIYFVAIAGGLVHHLQPSSRCAPRGASRPGLGIRRSLERPSHEGCGGGPSDRALS